MEISNKQTGLEAARAKRQAMAAAGETVERLNPLERAATRPSSLRLAINAKCFDCQGQDCDRGWRRRIGDCSVTKCPLYAVRPYQRDDADEAEP